MKVSFCFLKIGLFDDDASHDDYEDGGDGDEDGGGGDEDGGEDGVEDGGDNNDEMSLNLFPP